VETLLQDLRYAFRTISKTPLFTAVIVLTLGLGIGANTAVFSLLDAVFLKSLPVRDSQALVVFQWHGNKGPRYDELSSFNDCDHGHAENYLWGCSFSSPMLDVIEAKTKAFESMTGFAGPEEIHVSGVGTASVAAAEIVSGEYFHTLGVPAAIGRTIDQSDDSPASSPVVVFSYGYWKRSFGGDPSIVGRPIRLNNIPVTVIGVADQSFTYLSPGKRQDMWITRWSFAKIGFNEGWSRADDDGNAWLAILARLKPGVSVAQAQAEASLIFRNELVYGSHPLIDAQGEPALTLIPAEQGLTGQRARVTTQLYLLMLSVGILLLIACANVAALLLARSAARRHEIAVRVTLGASRSRLVRQLLTESILLSVLGGFTGVLFAYWGVSGFTQIITRSFGSFPFSGRPDLRVLIFTASVTILVGIFFGIVPAWQSASRSLISSVNGTPVTSALRSAKPGSFFGSANVLVIAQVALAVIVLNGAGLFVRTLHNLGSIDPGFNTHNLLIFTLDPVVAGYKTNQIRTLYEELQNEFAAVPGVTEVAYSQFALLNDNSSSQDVSIQGQSENVLVNILPIGPGFLGTMHIPLLLGRDLNRSDFDINRSGSVPSPSGGSEFLVPILVNDAFVRTYCRQHSPLGMLLNKGNGSSSKAGVSEGKISSPEWQIVGVVGDTKYGTVREPDPPIVYLPFYGGGARFEIRTSLAPESLVPVFRNIVGRHDSDLPMFNVSTQVATINGQISSERLVAQLSSFFGVIALLLASTGLYGLLSHQVTTRTKEIGIRKALGAQPANIIWLVIERGITLALLGALVGVVASTWITRFIKSLLFGVEPIDVATLIAVTALLFGVALAACFVPASQANRVDPMVALRHE
jgi:macrolide transport system ATP-binding/permease protein